MKKSLMCTYRVDEVTNEKIKELRSQLQKRSGKQFSRSLIERAFWLYFFLETTDEEKERIMLAVVNKLKTNL